MSLLRSTDLRDLATVDMAAAQSLAVGGDSWHVYRWAGDGTTSAKARTMIGRVTGYFAPVDSATSRGTEVGQPAAARSWTFTRVKGALLQIGDELEGEAVICRLGAQIDTIPTEQWEATRQ